MTLNSALAKGVDQLKHLYRCVVVAYTMLLMLPWLDSNEACTLSFSFHSIGFDGIVLDWYCVVGTRIAASVFLLSVYIRAG